jgi:hypothetical protein
MIPRLNTTGRLEAVGLALQANSLDKERAEVTSAYPNISSSMSAVSDIGNCPPGAGAGILWMVVPPPMTAFTVMLRRWA